MRSLHRWLLALCGGCFFWMTPLVLAAEEAGEVVRSAYIEMDPEFITNFQSQARQVGYVRVAVALKIASEKEADLVETHMPQLRNRLLDLIYAQTETQIKSHDAQEALRIETKTALQSILKEETGKEVIDEVLFTHFLWQ